VYKYLSKSTKNSYSIIIENNGMRNGIMEYFIPLFHYIPLTFLLNGMQIFSCNSFYCNKLVDYSFLLFHYSINILNI